VQAPGRHEASPREYGRGGGGSSSSSSLTPHPSQSHQHSATSNASARSMLLEYQVRGSTLSDTSDTSYKPVLNRPDPKNIFGPPHKLCDCNITTVEARLKSHPFSPNRTKSSRTHPPFL
jgi:hypothetical protein